MNQKTENKLTAMALLVIVFCLSLIFTNTARGADEPPPVPAAVNAALEKELAATKTELVAAT